MIFTSGDLVMKWDTILLNLIYPVTQIFENTNLVELYV